MAPLVEAGPDAIRGRYIVLLKPGTMSPQGVGAQLVQAHGGTVHHEYLSAVQGFAATLPPEAVDAIRRNPNVALVEEDAMVHTTTDQASPPSWGIDRIDSRTGTNSIYTYNATGAGVRAYIIDSGIRITHSDLTPRASVGIDLVDPADGMNGQDCNGHGTHVAGTVGGTLHGVAKNVLLVSVRVFGCTGGAPNSRIIAAVDWVTANAVKPAVVNMSLGGGFSSAVNTAVQNSINSGVPYVLSAGNENADACFNSPASSPNALTVGATASNNTRSPFSNWGNCLDIFAPGSAIVSSWATSDIATASLNGTSMAAPHVTGVAALFLEGNTTATPAQVNGAILGSASLNRVRTYDFGAPGLGAGSPNVFLYSLLTPYERIASLNPSDLAFTFVRTSGEMSMSADNVLLDFVASGTGQPHTGDDLPGEDVHITSTSETAIAPIQLRNVGTRNLEWQAVSNQSWLSAGTEDGWLAPGASTMFNTIVNSAGLAVGHTFGTLAINDDFAPATDEGVIVSVRVANATPLAVGASATGLSTFAGGFLFFEMHVPAVPQLVIGISGGTGDADLYVRYGDAPAFHRFDCRPFLGGNSETCAINYPPAGTYFIMLHAWAAFSGVTLSTSAGGPPPAASGIAATPFSSARVDVSWNDNSNNESGYVLQRTTIVGGSPTGWIGLGSFAANTTSFSDETVVGGTTYSYRVRGCNAVGCSSWNRSANVTPPVEVVAPSAPTNFTVVPTSPSTIDLAWTVSDVNTEAVEIQRRVRVDGTYTPYSEIGEVAPPDDEFTDSGLAEGTQHQYRIRACNTGGCSSFVTATAVRTPSTVPLAPTNAVTIATSGSTLRTDWEDQSNNELRFVVFRRTQNPDNTFGPWSEMVQTAPDETRFINTGLTGGTTHQYRVRACNNAGCSAYSIATAVTVPVIPAAPTGVSETVMSSTAINVAWGDGSTNEAEFQLFRRIKGLDDVFSAWVEIARPAANTTLYADTGLEAGRTYQYRVRACNPAGCSAYVAGAQVATPN